MMTYTLSKSAKKMTRGARKRKLLDEVDGHPPENPAGRARLISLQDHRPAARSPHERGDVSTLFCAEAQRIPNY